jgi:hypothetical protein
MNLQKKKLGLCMKNGRIAQTRPPTQRHLMVKKSPTLLLDWPTGSVNSVAAKTMF